MYDPFQRLTVAEVASRLGVNEKTVRRWIAAGELKAIRLGSNAGFRIRPEDLVAFERRRMVADAVARHLIDPPPTG